MKTEPKPHLENLKTLRTRLYAGGYMTNLPEELRTLRNQLLDIEFPTVGGICCFVSNGSLLTNLAHHILGLNPTWRGYWLLPLENGNYVTPRPEHWGLVHPTTRESCENIYENHYTKRALNPDLPLQPLDLARKKLVADVVELIDTLLGDQQ